MMYNYYMEKHKDKTIINEFEDFTPQQKKIIMERDGYRCVLCGRGIAEGVELQVDHIKDIKGKAIIENGQTLCAQHYIEKNNLGQTETSKKMFIRLYELSKKVGDIETQQFCAAILEVFEKFNVNEHIIWKK